MHGPLRLSATQSCMPTVPAVLPQIIDLMVLVVDASKGIQTQTAECIVIGEVAAADMVVALNKIGMWPGVGGALMGGGWAVNGCLHGWEQEWLAHRVHLWRCGGVCILCNGQAVLVPTV